jgi:hypothetical protein
LRRPLEFAEHPAVAVVDEHDLLGAQQMLRDGERAERVVAHDAAGVANHVGVALLQAEHARWVEAGVHARQHRHPARRGQREIALVDPPA